jgi:hypothetical protein
MATAIRASRPDPLAVVYFADGDPFFAGTEHARKPA